MDWVPTILEMVGEKNTSTDGVSLVPALLQKGSLADRDLFWHFPHYREPDIRPYSIIRSGAYKLIYYFDGSEAELYDLSNDPLEEKNLAKQLPFLTSQLKTKLDNWWKETDARLPVSQVD